MPVGAVPQNATVGAVNQYLNHLEKDQNGQYYMNYDNITNPRMNEMFKCIETRLRTYVELF